MPLIRFMSLKDIAVNNLISMASLSWTLLVEPKDWQHFKDRIVYWKSIRTPEILL